MPGVNWAKNLLLGRELTDKEMRDIPYPRLELHVHVMYKTIQMGTIIATIAAPVAAVVRVKPLFPIYRRYIRTGACIGVVMGPVMTEGMLYAKKATPESIWDRCYRLRYNAGQVRTDRYASWLGLINTVISPEMRLTYGVIGFSVGTLFAGCLSMWSPPRPKSKPVHKVEDKNQ